MAFALGLAWAASAAAQEIRIPFAEKVAIAAAPGQAEFDVYGRRFALTLENNSSLIAALPARQKADITPSQLLRGKIDGVPKSWVRLARVGRTLEGAIWDGQDLYVITSQARIASYLTGPLAAGPEDTVVYRLSDVQGSLPKDFCGLADDALPKSAVAPTALKQYKSLVADLRMQAANATLSDQLDISLVADTEFQAAHPSDTSAFMLSRLNTVDGIFREQVGVVLQAAAVQLAAPGNPLNTTSADQLLAKLADYRGADAQLNQAGITHLISGKDLDGDTIGIAYLDTLCERSQGVSISSSFSGSIWDDFVMAHELGHNFGARHDGAAGSSCESVPPIYLMAPAANGSSQFSQCSLDAMRPVIDRARAAGCIKPASYADVALVLPASPITQESTQITLPMTVRSVGTLAAAHAHLTINYDTSLSFVSATLTGGSCAPSGRDVECDLGDIPAGEDRVVQVSFVANFLGTFTIGGHVTADGDHYTGNDYANVQVGLRSTVDLALALTPSATTVFQSGTVDFTYDVTQRRSGVASGGVLYVGTNGFVVDSVDGGANACTIQTPTGPPGWSVTCQLAALSSGASTRVVVRAHPNGIGSRYVSGAVSVPSDGDSTNDYASATLNVVPDREVRTTVSTENLNAVIGNSYDLTYTITTLGRLPANAVEFRIGGSTQIELVSATPSAGTCAQNGSPDAYLCSLGNLNPGDVRTITVRVKAVAGGQSTVTTWTSFSDGANQFNSSVTTWIYSNVRTDVLADLQEDLSFDEGQEGGASFMIRSMGINAAQNVVATLTVPAPLRITRILDTTGSIVGAWQCTVVTPQQGRCTGSFASPSPGEVRYFNYALTSDTAATANVSLTTSTPDDGDPTDDSDTGSVTVRPGFDVALVQTSPKLVMNVGETGTATFMLTTGKNGASGVAVSVDDSPDYSVEAVQINGVDCPIVKTGLPIAFQSGCLVGDLAGNASVAVTVRYRASQSEFEGMGYVRAMGTYDSNFQNNAVAVQYVVQRMTDIRLSVNAPAISAQVGQLLHFPMLVVSTDAIAHNVVINIPLPAFTTLESVSASNAGLCTGTTTLQCTIPQIQAGAMGSIEFWLTTSTAGTFTSNVTMTADNDSTATNNSTSVAVTVTALSTGGGSSSGGSSSSGGGSSGGGGGGGRIEWLGLAFLGLLAAQRLRRRDVSPHPARATRH